MGVEMPQNDDSPRGVIVSHRLSLRPFAAEFSLDVLREFDEDITRYMMPAPLANMAEAMGFVARCEQGWESGEFLMFVITDIDGGEFLGGCSVQAANGPEPELGVWLKKSAHGHGYGREAVGALVEWVRENMSCDHLIYPVDRRNIPSRKIAESLGGLVFQRRTRRNRSGFELDEVVYRIELGS
jgi:RimJ/RimL family protein N-acetyltransferase